MTDPTPSPDTSAPAPSPHPVLVDAWPWAHPFRLDGWAERNAFRPLWAALLALVLAFVLFQLVIAPLVIGIGVAVDLIASGQTEAPDAAGLMEQLQERVGLLMTANTIGQVIGFGLFTWLIARLSTRQVREFLRIRKPDGVGMALAALGWVPLFFVVLWSGQLNAMIPLPDWLRELEQTQIDLIEGILMGGDLSTPVLFLVLAITPALCEELMFRGYLQRQVERAGGAWMSILAVGIVFGLYHLRLSQAIPLSILGVYLGFVVWATGSLWTGVVIHLLNNGFQVLAAGYARSQPDLDLEAIESAGIPWYVGVVCAALSAAVCYAIAQRRRQRVGDTPDARPAEAAPRDLPTPLSPASSPAHV